MEGTYGQEGRLERGGEAFAEPGAVEREDVRGKGYVGGGGGGGVTKKRDELGEGGVLEERTGVYSARYGRKGFGGRGYFEAQVKYGVRSPKFIWAPYA